MLLVLLREFGKFAVLCGIQTRRQRVRVLKLAFSDFPAVAALWTSNDGLVCSCDAPLSTFIALLILRKFRVPWICLQATLLLFHCCLACSALEIPLPRLPPGICMKSDSVAEGPALILQAEVGYQARLTSRWEWLHHLRIRSWLERNFSMWTQPKLYLMILHNVVLFLFRCSLPNLPVGLSSMVLVRVSYTEAFRQLEVCPTTMNQLDKQAKFPALTRSTSLCTPSVTAIVPQTLFLCYHWWNKRVNRKCHTSVVTYFQARISLAVLAHSCHSLPHINCHILLVVWLCRCGIPATFCKTTETSITDSSTACRGGFHTSEKKTGRPFYWLARKHAVALLLVAAF